jgi:type IV pilus assembly protein PilA
VVLIIVIIFGTIFLIGLLAAIALPGYYDYTIRAKLTDGMALAAEYKTGVSDYVAATGQWPSSVFDLDHPAIAPGENM